MSLQHYESYPDYKKKKIIVIKACDKGAGVIILNDDEYMRACYSHLTSYQTENIPYYIQVDDLEIERTKSKISNALKEALEGEIISKDEYSEMIADDKGPGRFYCNFKVHKPLEKNKAPPVRPIISGSGSITEGIATFVNHHIEEIGIKHETSLQDTPDFLRMIDKNNEGPKLDKNAILATMDVEGLYTNITHEEGIHCMKEELNKTQKSKVTTDFIVKLMEIILYHNVFEFHEFFWKQSMGAAMGSKPVPHSWQA